MESPIPAHLASFWAANHAGDAEWHRKIANAKALDVISLGIDQDAQENFFHPERQDPRRKGAGGVPVHKREESDLSVF